MERSVMRQTLSAKAPWPTGVESRGLSWYQGSPSGEGELVRDLDLDSFRTLNFGVMLDGSIEWLPGVRGGVLVPDGAESVFGPESAHEAYRFMSTEKDWVCAWHGCRSASVMLFVACAAQVPDTQLVLAGCDIIELLLPHLPQEETRPQKALGALRAWAEGRGSLAAAKRALKECEKVNRGYVIASAVLRVPRPSGFLRRTAEDPCRQAASFAERAADILGRLQYDSYPEPVQVAQAALAQVVGRRLPLPVLCGAIARQRRGHAPQGWRTSP